MIRSSLAWHNKEVKSYGAHDAMTLAANEDDVLQYRHELFVHGKDILRTSHRQAAWIRDYNVCFSFNKLDS
jgi:hypothetical protein